MVGRIKLIPEEKNQRTPEQTQRKGTGIKPY